MEVSRGKSKYFFSYKEILTPQKTQINNFSLKHFVHLSKYTQKAIKQLI